METQDDPVVSTPARPRPTTRFSPLRDLAPRASDYAGLRSSWKSDVIAGLTVGVVAVPLALAFGITTGLGADAGLITAIVAGLVAAVFGGSNVQVSGPTGAMTVVLVPIVARYGAEAVFVVSMVAGVCLIVAAVARLGRYIAFIPWPVVEGFTIGIAIIIFLQQVPPALGVDKPEGDNTAVVAAKAVADAFGDGSVQAIAIVVLVAVMMIGLPRVRRSLPASLIAVAVATIVAHETIARISPRIGSLPSSLPMPSLPDTSFAQLKDLLSAGIAVALLAAIESLLSARVADGMSDSARHNPDRELFGQGLANVVSPLFGGMPATGAIARTAVNVRAGARTRRRRGRPRDRARARRVLRWWSRLGDPRSPRSAGVLMATAIRMVETHNVRAVLRSTHSDALVLLLTATATIAFDLIVAVEIGVAVAVLLALRHVARNSGAEIEPLEPRRDGHRCGRGSASPRAHRRLPIGRLAVLRGRAMVPDRTHRCDGRESRDPAPFWDTGSRCDRRASSRRDRRANSNREESRSC